MLDYCKSGHLGPPLQGLHPTSEQSIKLPIAILEHIVEIDESEAGAKWTRSDRDLTAEIVVPDAELDKLGSDVFAGRLVKVTCGTAAGVQHIARIVPAGICKRAHIGAKAAEVLGINEATCTHGPSHKPVAFISPMFAYNLGIPYAMAQLLSAEDFKYAFKHSEVTISSIPEVWPPASEGIKTAAPWTPGTCPPRLHNASHVALALCQKPEKVPPFNIVEYNDATQAQADAMSQVRAACSHGVCMLLYLQVSYGRTACGHTAPPAPCAGLCSPAHCPTTTRCGRVHQWSGRQTAEQPAGDP